MLPTPCTLGEDWRDTLDDHIRAGKTIYHLHGRYINITRGAYANELVDKYARPNEMWVIENCIFEPVADGGDDLERQMEEVRHDRDIHDSTTCFACIARGV